MPRKWPAPIDHLYILCDPQHEPDRATYLYKWLEKMEIDPDCWTMLSKCYGKTLSSKDAHAAYNPFVDRKPVEQIRNFNSYNLKPSEISLGINWEHNACKAIRDKHKCVMMFESDVLIPDDFMKNLTEAMGLLEDRQWDFLSLSAGANLRPLRPANEIHLGWFPPIHSYFHTRTTDAMIFKVEMLEKIVTTFIPFAEIIDWELNYQLTLHGSRSFWLDPPIIRQGSATGDYKTTL